MEMAQAAQEEQLLEQLEGYNQIFQVLLLPKHFAGTIRCLQPSSRAFLVEEGLATQAAVDKVLATKRWERLLREFLSFISSNKWMLIQMVFWLALPAYTGNKMAFLGALHGYLIVILFISVRRFVRG